MRPTLFGVRLGAFYVLCVGAYFATPYVNLFFLLLGFLSLVLVAALAASRASLRGVGVATPPGGTVTLAAGSPARVGAELRGEGRRARFGVAARIELEGPGTGPAVLTGLAPVVAPDRSVPLALAHDGPLARGIWRGEAIEVSSTYPFGVLRSRRSVPARVELIIHPAPSEDLAASEAGSLSAMMHDWLGGGAAVAPSGLQPTSLREHRPGESLRTVHWKASARRGKLVALEWEADDSEALEVILDRRAAPTIFEGALSDLCAVALAARESKEILQVRTQGRDGTFGEGHGSFDDLLRFLAEVQPLGSGAEPPPPASPRALRLPRGQNQTPAQTQEAALAS